MNKPNPSVKHTLYVDYCVLYIPNRCHCTRFCHSHVCVLCSSRKYPYPPQREIILRPPSPQDFLSPERLFRPAIPLEFSWMWHLESPSPPEIPVLIELLYLQTKANTFSILSVTSPSGEYRKAILSSCHSYN